MVATKSPSSTVFVFDYSKHKSTPTDNICRPQFRCKGHEAEGYGLSWNPHVEGQLLSGSDDSLICLWDINQTGTEVQPMQTRRAHADVVEDVDWHRHFPYLFGSVGDDSKLLMWDVRENTNTPTHTVNQAHAKDVHCLDFNPFNEFLLVTGGSDKVVNLWDIRNLSQKLHAFEGHNGGVFQVSWAPFDEKVLASCSSDRRVHVWDLSQIGTEQTPEDAEDGPPELLFVHGGHTAKVSDFSWNLNDDWVMSSCAEDNILQIWEMVSIYYTSDIYIYIMYDTYIDSNRICHILFCVCSLEISTQMTRRMRM